MCYVHVAALVAEYLHRKSKALQFIYVRFNTTWLINLSTCIGKVCRKLDLKVFNLIKKNQSKNYGQEWFIIIPII